MIRTTKKEKTLLDLFKLVCYILKHTYTFPKLLLTIFVKIFDSKFSQKTIRSLTVIFGTILFLEAEKKEYMIPFYTSWKRMVLRAIQDYIDGFSSDFTNLSIDWSIDISGLTTFVSFVVSSELFKTVTIIFARVSIFWGLGVVAVDILKEVEVKGKLLKDIKKLDRYFRIMSSCFFLGMISLKDTNYVWQMLPLFWSYYVCIIGVAPFRFSQWLLKKAFKLIISYQKNNIIPESFAIVGEFDEKPHWPPMWVGITGFFMLVYLTFTGHIFSVLALATVATTFYLFEDYRLRGFQLEEDE